MRLAISTSRQVTVGVKWWPAACAPETETKRRGPRHDSPLPQSKKGLVGRCRRGCHTQSSKNASLECTSLRGRELTALWSIQNCIAGSAGTCGFAGGDVDGLRVPHLRRVSSLEWGSSARSFCLGAGQQRLLNAPDPFPPHLPLKLTCLISTSLQGSLCKMKIG